MPKTTEYSRIVAGTMTWGSWGKQLSVNETIDLMEHCLESGVSTFDHADIYGNYTNERLFGQALAQSGIPRERMQLVTKCGIQMTQGRENKVKHYQYDADYIVWSAERSLKELQTDYLDIFLLHRPSPLLHPDAVAMAVEKLKNTGKIKHFGVSNFSPSQLALVDSRVPVEVNQVEFSLAHVQPMEDGTFDDCLTHGRMAMAWSPLGGYFGETNAQKERIAPVLKAMSKKYGVDESQVLLAFILKHPAGVFPVIGTANKERIKASMDAVRIPLDPQDWFLLLEASKGSEVP